MLVAEGTPGAWQALSGHVLVASFLVIPKGTAQRAMCCHLPEPLPPPRCLLYAGTWWPTHQFATISVWPPSCLDRAVAWGPSVPRPVQAWTEKPGKYLMTIRQGTVHLCGWRPSIRQGSDPAKLHGLREAFLGSWKPALAPGGSFHF